MSSVSVYVLQAGLACTVSMHTTLYVLQESRGSPEGVTVTDRMRFPTGLLALYTYFMPATWEKRPVPSEVPTALAPDGTIVVQLLS